MALTSAGNSRVYIHPTTLTPVQAANLGTVEWVMDDSLPAVWRSNPLGQKAYCGELAYTQWDRDLYSRPR